MSKRSTARGGGLFTLRKRRGYEVETFFGDLRQNGKFNRFSLRGLKKVEHELGLLAMAYNLRKLAIIDQISKTFFAIYSAILNILSKYRPIRASLAIFDRIYKNDALMRQWATVGNGF